jgi:hypothetical protein
MGPRAALHERCKFTRSAELGKLDRILRQCVVQLLVELLVNRIVRDCRLTLLVRDLEMIAECVLQELILEVSDVLLHFVGGESTIRLHLALNERLNMLVRQRLFERVA